MTEGPLTGITVLDLSTVGPATRCSRLLADYGAQVVKVGAPPRAGVANHTLTFHAYSGQRDLRLTWDGLQERALLEIGSRSRYGPPLIVPGAAPAAYSDDELAVAFAPQRTGGGGAAAAASGVVVANVFVASAPR